MLELRELIDIVGPTGSGKTSLLMALLGEMRYTPLQDGSWFNLPRHGGVAFAPQESWVLNATIKAGTPLPALTSYVGLRTEIGQRRVWVGLQRVSVSPRSVGPIFLRPLATNVLYTVIKACALERDLELFESGDNTEVGEKGLTLSGGQKVMMCAMSVVTLTNRELVG